MFFKRSERQKSLFSIGIGCHNAEYIYLGAILLALNLKGRLA